MSGGRVFKEKETNRKCKGPGARECLAYLQETARKLRSENVNDRLGHRHELQKEKACINKTQDQENLNKKTQNQKSTDKQQLEGKW